LAGFPTILGSMLGSATSSELIGALFFSAAAGALLYVIIELLKIIHSSKRDESVLVGIVLGVLLMYFTGLLVG
jgi:ZIP family zinc transporter